MCAHAHTRACKHTNTSTHPRTHTCAPPLGPRSDSNGEDLEGYAGAGLYESITMDPTEVVRVDYSDDPITVDPGVRNKVGSVACNGVR